MNDCICCLLFLVRLSRIGTNQPGLITSEAVNIAECSFCIVRAASGHQRLHLWPTWAPLFPFISWCHKETEHDKALHL